MGRQTAGGIAGATSGLHRAVRAIVLDALTRGVGETLTTNGEFQERLGVGAGTLQRAVDLLADRGALRTTSRGHLGRRIDEIGLGDCWQAAGLSPVRFILSPSGPIELDELEASLGDELTTLGVPFTMHHSRGGNGRLRAVAEGRYDIAIVSRGTFEGVRRSGMVTGLGAARVLGEGTYYAPDRLVVLRGPRSLDPALRETIAIDRESFDHEALTVAEFPDDGVLRYVQMDFTEVPGRVLAGLVGAGVWHVTASAVPLFLTGLSVDQFATSAGRAVRDSLSAAAAVAGSQRPELTAIVDALDLPGLERRQRVAINAEEASRERLAAEQRAQRQSAVG